MNTIVPYAIPAALAALTPLYCITIQFALEAMDKEAAYTKIAGSGLDFGKSSPLTISVK
jgi:hypothetical protein